MTMTNELFCISPKYLTTVIPYEERMGGPNNQSLTKLIESKSFMNLNIDY